MIGVSGRSRVDMIISVGRKFIRFGFSNCHFIFMLFVDGNIVSEVE